MWDHRLGRLYWVDIEGKLLLYRESSGEEARIPLSGMPGTVVLSQDPDSVILAQDDGLKQLHLPSKEAKHLLDFPEDPTFRFNDGKCDAQGRLWVGTMERDGKSGAGTLYCIEPDFSIRPVLAGVTCSNGIVWTQDHTQLFYIDSATRQVQGFEFDLATGRLSHPRTAVSIPEERGYPDGMAIDVEDQLWVAHWNGSCVARYNSQTGATLEVVEVPTPKVTSCVFGGPNLDTLFVTTALGSHDGGWTDREAYPLSGALFSTSVAISGCVAKPFGAK